MSKIMMLRSLVNERLAAAAEEIFALFERTIAEHEEEMCGFKEELRQSKEEEKRSTEELRRATEELRRATEEKERQRRLLDCVLNPQVLVKRIGVTEKESLDEQNIFKEEPEPQSNTPESNYQLPESLCISVCVKNETEAATSSLQQSLTGEHTNDWSIHWEPQDSCPSQEYNQNYNQVQIKISKTESEEEETQLQVLDCVLSPQVQVRRAGVQTEAEIPHKLNIFKKEPEPLSITPESNYQPPESQCIPESTLPPLQLNSPEEDPYDWTGPWEPQDNSTSQEFNQNHSQNYSPTVQTTAPENKKRLRPRLFHKSYKMTTKPASIKKDILKVNGVDNNTQKCPICKKTFKSDLWKHLLVHTDERPYSCSTCHKGFTRSSSLILHRRLHMWVKAFRCSVCQQGFNQKSHLERHIIRSHPGVKFIK